jgi:polyisoprenyl-teichoic acid--peptidoglycan teichoic acid transferase
MSETSTPIPEKLPVSWLKWAVLAAFLIAAILTAVLTFLLVRDLVTSWEMTSLPGIALTEPTRTPSPGAVPSIEDPLQPQTGPEPLEWDGANRVTVLVMGLDFGDVQAANPAPRTDTMMLLTLDPLTRTAGMLSIPRDLWVNIPNMGYGRINTAHRLGELRQWPDGGGPGLAMATVENLLGVPVDYYLLIDFGAFTRFIDELGGITVQVPETIRIDALGSGADTIMDLPPGEQTLTGDWALAYARARNTEGGDFDRANRQQQVILAIRDKVLSLDMLPTLIQKSGVLYEELSSGLHTNLTLDQVIRLAWMGSQVPEENIRKGVISPPHQVQLLVSDAGDSVLKPIADQVRLLRDQIFTAAGPASPAAASLPMQELIELEGARVSILNGTYSVGLAAETAEYLKEQGVNVTTADNAPARILETEITFYTGKPYSLKYLVDLFRVVNLHIHHRYDPTSPVDIQITLGEDWANNNPMP